MWTLTQVQDPRWWCPMCGPEAAWGWDTLLLMALFWIVLILAVGWLVLRIVGDGGRGGAAGDDASRAGDRAEEILRERFARGEIDREAFQRMLDELRRGAPVDRLRAGRVSAETCDVSRQRRSDGPLTSRG